MTPLALTALQEPAVLVALITTLGTVLVALIAILADWARKRLDVIEHHAEASREQVQNSHTTNLREDIDRIHDDVRAVLGMSERNTEAIASLASDLRQERIERLVVAQKVDKALLPRAIAEDED